MNGSRSANVAIPKLAIVIAHSLHLDSVGPLSHTIVVPPFVAVKIWPDDSDVRPVDCTEAVDKALLPEMGLDALCLLWCRVSEELGLHPTENEGSEKLLKDAFCCTLASPQQVGHLMVANALVSELIERGCNFLLNRHLLVMALIEIALPPFQMGPEPVTQLLE